MIAETLSFLYQSGFQQETDGTLSEDNLIKGLFAKVWTGSKEITREAEYREALSPAGLRDKGSAVTGTQSSSSHRRGPQQGCDLRQRNRATTTHSGPSGGNWRINTSTLSAALCPLAGVPCGLNRTGRQRVKEPRRSQNGTEKGPQRQVEDLQHLNRSSQGSYEDDSPPGGN